jgi:glyoxylase I family protein
MSERVEGIGGVFFRARDPERLRRWYGEHLGVTFDPLWEQRAGPTVWGPFEADTDYFGRADQAWMINFRVRDLDAMVAQLRAAGIEVEPGPQAEEAGRFARTWDPEGNPIELWEPLTP